MIDFQEDDDYGYKNRTIKNASADVTIALAADFNTAGEKLTKNSVRNQNNLYIPVSLDVFQSNDVVHNTFDDIAKSIISLDKKDITLNIAGNGIYTLKDTYMQNQKSVDYFVLVLIKEVIKRLDGKVSISLIRSGGQSGADEAGAKAGLKLGIPTLVLSPKGWRYRNELSQDIMNEELFKKRFETT